MENNPSVGEPLAQFPPMIMVGDVIVHSDILTECFRCDISRCHGRCCEEGDAGAPLTLDEVAYIESILDQIWPKLSARAQSVIDRQGVAYTDPDGDLVTSIIGDGDCVFRGPYGCLLPRRPISCHLYPIREKRFAEGLTGINYHRWDICRSAVCRREDGGVPLYVFLADPLVRRFGQEWYDELCAVARQLGV